MPKPTKAIPKPETAPPDPFVVGGSLSLTISIIPGERPNFAFHGLWTTHDVNAISRSLYREYRMFLRNLRRDGALASSEPKEA